MFRLSIHISSRLSVLLLLCLFVACTGTSPSGECGFLKQELDRVRISNGLPGLTVAVFSGDSVYCIASSGVKRKGSDEPLGLSNKYHLGSNTKAFIAFAAASMVEEGIIGWDTRFLDLCPEYAEPAGPGYRDITLIRLLRHQAGLVSKETESLEIMAPNLGNDSVIDRNTLFLWALGHERFNGGFQYSNTGYVMAAEMLERASGMSWRELVRTRIFSPLSIEGSFGWPASGDTSQTWGHYTDPGTGDYLPHDPGGYYTLDRLGLSPAGDLSMAPAEYISFLQDNLNGYTGKGGVLSQESYRMMHGGTGYGLGWLMSESVKGLNNVSIHSGSGGTFYCQTFLFMNDDLGVVFFTNCTPPDPQSVFDPVLTEIVERMVHS
jgi:D-alanyl-D-alanine carboxypeptidase